jgi:hypothetical protein
MRKYIKKSALSTLFTLCFASALIAGNEQRNGQAGAAQLLINPWAQSSALADASIASISGFESVFGNVAGSARLNKTEVLFVHTSWLKGTDINLNSFGISQKIGDAGVLSLSVMNMNPGEIIKTTESNPDGDGTTFSINHTNIGVSYAKEFSNSIYGGITIKVINEQMTNLSATGVAFDAGVQYITGSREQIKFGVTMKNVGPTMKVTGDGMSVRGTVNYAGAPITTLEQRSAEYELPSLIKLGMSYDFDLGETHNLTIMGAFTENSFSKNQFHGGLEYGYRGILILRGGYLYENGINSDVDRTTALTGLTAGFSLEIPLKKGEDKKMAVDYSYRDTDPFNGIHSIGFRISL